MRYHYTHTRIATNKMTDKTSCWQNGRTGISFLFGRNVKWPKPIWQNIWWFLHTGLPPRPTMLFLGIYPQEIKSIHSQKRVGKEYSLKLIHISQASINGTIDKRVYKSVEYYLAMKRDYLQPHIIMDESQEHSAERKKNQSEECILYDSIYSKFQNRKN